MHTYMHTRMHYSTGKYLDRFSLSDYFAAHVRTYTHNDTFPVGWLSVVEPQFIRVYLLEM